MKVSKELKGLIAQMFKPLKGLSMSLVMEGLSGNRVLPFNPNDNKDKILLQSLQIVAKKAGQKVKGSSKNSNISLVL
ncbi:MAG: hypothetical protein QME58_13620 [Bacteroidota bacterium]|nr:hypothetical protein [Bacteroidota bacterium]